MRARLAAGVLGIALVASGAQAQQVQLEPIVFDSIGVEGTRRLARETVLATAGIPVGQPVSFRDLQRALSALFGLKQFDDVRFEQGRTEDRVILNIVVQERPLLTGWSVQGVENVSERKVRGKVRLLAGRPFDRAEAARSRASIDSLYKDEGYVLTNVVVRELPQPDGTVRAVFDIDEGRRVTISEVRIEGNERFSDAQVVGKMSLKPEGFWWFRSGEFNEDKLELDIRDRIPRFYASRGYIDFQILSDTLLVDERTGKATLQLTVREGEPYEVGDFEIVGNRYFPSSQLERYYPFGRSGGFLTGGRTVEQRTSFNQERWDEATQQVRTLYMNNGYIYAQIAGTLSRRTAEDGRNVVDLRWQIAERQPAIINKVIVRGNTVTHEDVIRRAIVMVPGDVMRQDALIRSYQNVSNLNFFEQPLPIPTTEPANQQGDVNVVFNVKERHTGNINFGASVGQGTGLGGFIGLDEPNLFGQAKRIALQWQFGRNINNFNITYTDPALRGSWVSGTVSLHSSRLRYTVADLGRITSRGGSLQLGFPVRGSRYTRLFASYAFEQSSYDSPAQFTSRFFCDNCILSSLGLTLVHDTRIDLPFPTAGVMHRFALSQGGGPLGGSGNFRRGTFEGRWYAPLAALGGDDPLASPLKLVLGLGAQAGFLWGDAGPHFRQLFSMGGVQFGIPLRGYEEFSITPQGFDPLASGQQASTVNAFGGSYLALTGEVGLRISQAIYISTFLDAGNVWESPAKFNPSRLFRGAGVGLSLVTPLGPIGIDYAYGFDRVDFVGNPDPGWKFHFRLGNFF